MAALPPAGLHTCAGHPAPPAFPFLLGQVGVGPANQPAGFPYLELKFPGLVAAQVLGWGQQKQASRDRGIHARPSRGRPGEGQKGWDARPCCWLSCLPSGGVEVRRPLPGPPGPRAPSRRSCQTPFLSGLCLLRGQALGPWACPVRPVGSSSRPGSFLGKQAQSFLDATSWQGPPGA